MTSPEVDDDSKVALSVVFSVVPFIILVFVLVATVLLIFGLACSSKCKMLEFTPVRGRKTTN